MCMCHVAWAWACACGRHDGGVRFHRAALTGLVHAGAWQGDLADPGFSIPYGTLAAVSTAFLLYVLLIIGQAGSLDRVGLQFDMDVMQDACFNQYFIVLGVTTACLSTALGSLFGSARILQAIARDDIYPILKPFAQVRIHTHPIHTHRSHPQAVC